MGFRFRRSIKLLPGIRLNVSKSGVSTSIGVPGAHVSIGPKGTRTTVGIPGSGISYSERVDAPTQQKVERGQTPAAMPTNYQCVLWVALAFVILYAFTR